MRALKAWAIERMTAGTQTPWAWFQFMKLLEVLDTFIESGDEVEATSKPREAGSVVDRAPAAQPKAEPAKPEAKSEKAPANEKQPPAEKSVPQ